MYEALAPGNESRMPSMWKAYEKERPTSCSAIKCDIASLDVQVLGKSRGERLQLNTDVYQASLSVNTFAYMILRRRTR